MAAETKGKRCASMDSKEENDLDGLKREHFLQPDSDQIDLNLLLKAVLDISERLDRDKDMKSTEQNINTQQETTRSAEKTVEFDKRSIASSTSSRSKSNRRYDGSKRVPPTERKNMSFSNNKVIDIDRENQRLLRKITSTTRGRPISASASPGRTLAEPMRVQTAAEINRSRFQRRVDEENQKILSRLQAIKPTPALSKEFLSKEAASQKRYCTNVSKVRPSSARSTRSTRSRMSRASSESSLMSTTSDMASVASSSVSRASSTSRRSRRKREFPKAVWEPGW